MIYYFRELNKIFTCLYNSLIIFEIFGKCIGLLFKKRNCLSELFLPHPRVAFEIIPKKL